MDSILTVKNLKKYYGEEPNITRALDGVNLTVERGEFVGIVGTSGSGKTTLLNMIGALDNFTEGEIAIDGIEISKMKDEDLSIFRRKNIGFVFQDYNLIPILNVYENIVLPIELDNRKVDKFYLDNILEMLKISNKIYEMPNNLSGGQQQRVAIARALVTKPALILADEPTGNLDSSTSQDVMALLRASNKEFEQTMIMITHNKGIAQLSDRIIQIEDGKIFA